MIPWLDKWDSQKQLEIMEEAIREMGGEDEASTQLLAQRDMIKYELDYHTERCQDWRTGGLTAVLMVTVFCVWIFVLDKV